MTIGTRIYTWLKGELVGQDAYGNRYYQERGTKGKTGKRWVLYKGMPEPTKVPAEWHSWLHYIADSPEQVAQYPSYEWEKPHKANMSGTEAAYVPPGHIKRGGRRYDTESDYQSWQP